MLYSLKSFFYYDFACLKYNSITEEVVFLCYFETATFKKAVDKWSYKTHLPSPQLGLYKE